MFPGSTSSFSIKMINRKRSRTRKGSDSMISSEEEDIDTINNKITIVKLKVIEIVS